ncbi:MAG: methyltransferase domain-containing protein [Oscillospiraceae bacterium]|nr:methyltransferase domain-containing protein [Oscillospiraceae bacterium]
MNTSSNEIWENCANYTDFEESRPLLFRDDMREQFFRWFRIKPSDNVLDGGCGPGTLTRFIARGLDNGTATGFDISRKFVDYANNKAQAEGLSNKLKFVKEDGFALSFADNTFDAVVNHTYIGVLSDVEAGLRELIRVCKSGGWVSASCSSRSFPGLKWAGDKPFDGETRMRELQDKHEQAFRKVYTVAELKQDDYWSVYRYPRLFAKCGLTDIHIHPYASGFSYNDSYWSDEFKEYRIKSGIGRDIEIFEEQRKDPKFAENGFTEFDELISLKRQEQEYLLASMNDDDSWSWNATMHVIVTGRKA